MELTIFESDKGDCMLLENAAQTHRMLVDGGMERSMREVVRHELGKLRTQNKDLDLVYVSHVDNDHITGVLRLLTDEAEWRTFLHHQNSPTPVSQPNSPRPPVIKGILHNAFKDQINTTDGEIKSLLVNAAGSLYASGVPDLVDRASEMESIALGIQEALKVSALVRHDALNIPLNQPPGVSAPSKLLYAGRPGDRFTLGGMNFTLIGPTEKELTALRKGWQTWIRASKPLITELRREIRRSVEGFTAGHTINPFDLGSWNGVPATKGVTAPNVASLMYLVEEAGKTLLLTGDGLHDHIIDGLQREGFMPHGHAHLDVLKVPHHGSSHNLDARFARMVSADHYVFGANGEHGNPDEDVLERIFESRLGTDPSKRALAPQAAGSVFHWWFSTTSAAGDPSLKRTTVFKAREATIEKLRKKSKGKLKVHFNQGASIALAI